MLCMLVARQKHPQTVTARLLIKVLSINVEPGMATSIYSAKVVSMGDSIDAKRGRYIVKTSKLSDGEECSQSTKKRQLRF